MLYARKRPTRREQWLPLTVLDYPQETGYQLKTSFGVSALEKH